MRTLQQKRRLSCVAMLTFMVTTTVFCGYTIRSRVALQDLISSTQTIGKFEVPVLSGWESRVEEKPRKRHQGVRNGKRYDFTRGPSKSLKQTRTIGPSKISLEMEIYEQGAVVQQSEIEQGVKAAEKIETLMSDALQTQYVVLQSGRVHFRKLPGYLSHTRSTSMARKQVRDIETLTFLSGDRKRVYTITKTLEGPAVAEEAQSVANEGWSLLIDNLRDSPNV
jgi:hypothetical protein